MSQAAIPSQAVTSLQEYLKVIETSYAGEDQVLFRGQAEADWDLTPRIARMKLRLRHQTDPHLVENKIVADFRRLSPVYTRDAPMSTAWETLAIAQHHGLPTRLLDWSTNPLVALWFAICEPPKSKTAAAVWIYRVNDDDHLEDSIAPDDLRKTSVFRPQHLSPRIIAQSGWFTAHIYSPDKKTYSDFRKVRDKKNRLRTLTKLPINPLFTRIHRDLTRCAGMK